MKVFTSFYRPAIHALSPHMDDVHHAGLLLPLGLALHQHRPPLAEGGRGGVSEEGAAPLAARAAVVVG